ncbi:formate dehydrogenase major subunit [Cytobacillus eiseniae]|nr:formate dehydrogenase major subunit [Cytobacillus eiseniae]
MEMTRRQFLKISGAVAATLAVIELGFDEKGAQAKSKEFKIAELKPTPTICPYCAVGCGILVYSKGDDVVYTEGDPDHPINEGSLCSKGTTVRQVYTSEKRITKPLYRAPGADKWEEVDWDFALDKVAKNIKETRDRTFIHKENGLTVNRTDSIAYLGGAALDNEECHLLQKLFRAGLGLTFIEHQARI